MRRDVWSTLAIGLAVLWSTAASAQDPVIPADEACETSAAKIPKFIMDALVSPQAVKAKLYIDRDGTVERSKVVLRREGMPEWTHGVADEKLGKGEDLSYEAEVYADGAEVYEIVRRIEGTAKKISLQRDRKVRYVETVVDRASVPAAVSATVAKLGGFQADEWRRREGESISEFHVQGTVAGIPHRARLRADGTLQSVGRHLAAEVEVAITSRPEPAVK